MKDSIFTQLQAAYRDEEDFRLREVCGLKVVSLDTMTDGNKVSEFVMQPIVYRKRVASVDDFAEFTAAAAVVKPCPTYQ